MHPHVVAVMHRKCEVHDQHHHSCRTLYAKHTQERGYHHARLLISDATQSGQDKNGQQHLVARVEHPSRPPNASAQHGSLSERRVADRLTTDCFGDGRPPGFDVDRGGQVHLQVKGWK